MGVPSLKTPHGKRVWSSDRSGRPGVFITQEADRRYYVWVRSPDMVKYGYSTGYAWSFNLGSKRAAIARARREVPYARDASPRRPPPLPGADVRTMAQMLSRAGYAGAADKARRLSHEGIGPSELAWRLQVDRRPVRDPGRKKRTKRTKTRRAR